MDGVDDRMGIICLVVMEPEDEEGEEDEEDDDDGSCKPSAPRLREGQMSFSMPHSRSALLWLPYDVDSRY